MFGEAAQGFTGFYVLALLFLLQALLQWWLRYRSIHVCFDVVSFPLADSPQRKRRPALVL
jgi:high-affinity Fe2+/Pb2+ permease